MKAILPILILLLLTPCVNAGVWIASDKKTGEIYSMSNEDDFRGVHVDSEYLEKEDVDYEKLSGNLDNYDLRHHPTFYKRSNGSFVLDVDKLAKAEKVALGRLRARKIRPQKIKSKLFDLYENDLAKFSQIYPIISDLIEYKDFPRLKKYIQGLLQSGSVTQQEYDAFISVLSQNHVDIGNDAELQEIYDLVNKEGKNA